MLAFYNDNNSYCCSWLSNLIDSGLLTPGVICNKSIHDLNPEDLQGYTRVHLFAGIGGWDLALQQAGWPESRPVWTGSCPCQPFSNAGRQGGISDPRHLWPEMLRLISQCCPPAVFGEQIASRLGRDWLSGVFTDLETAGYACAGANLPAASVGAPHLRQRLFWAASCSCLGQPRQWDSWAGRAGFEDSRQTSSLADSECRPAERHRLHMAGASEGLQGEASERERIRDDSGNGSAISSLADHASQRPYPWDSGTLQGQPIAAWPSQQPPGRSRSHAANPMGNPQCPGLEGGADQPSYDNQELQATERTGSNAGWVGEPDCTGLQQGSETPQTARHRNSLDSASSWHWASSRLILCRDGKIRRIPAEPAFYPLAHGIPTRMAADSSLETQPATEVLRGYGNAIVPQVAAIFIKAAMGCLPEDQNPC